MPNIKSAIKRVSVTEKKTAVNKTKKSEIRTSLKKARNAVATSAENAGELLRDTQSALDKAAAKGYLHKNNVARKQSKLAKAANKQ
ncbi:MAG TPA: 30S ribosomal protein S20 [Clostridiales bacterium]|nr:30S ribosomal protein S20 [Clostridiales bacterium]